MGGPTDTREDPARRPGLAGVAGTVGSVAEWVLGLVLIGAVLVNVVNASGRYLFSVAFTGADELMVFTMIFVVMTGAVLALAGRRHINISLIPSYAKGRTRHALHIVYDVVALGVASYVTYASWSFVTRIGALGTKSMTLGIPMTVPHSAILLGFAAMTLVAAASLVQSIRALIADGATLEPEGGR
ncbi:MAG: TRAP transporter small permease [Inquilinaceae bacterium]